MTFAEREWIVRNELSIRHIKLTDEERLGAAKQEEAKGDSSSKGTPMFYAGGGRGGGRGRFGDQGGRGSGSGGGRFGNGSGGGSGEKNKSHIQCYQCKGWGHYKNECPNGAGSGGSKELPSM